MKNFEYFASLLANTSAKLRTFEYNIMENLRTHFARSFKHALIFTIHTFSNPLVFVMFQSQRCAFQIILNFDSSCSLLKVIEDDLMSTFRPPCIYMYVYECKTIYKKNLTNHYYSYCTHKIETVPPTLL